MEDFQNAYHPIFLKLPQIAIEYLVSDPHGVARLKRPNKNKQSGGVAANELNRNNLEGSSQRIQQRPGTTSFQAPAKSTFPESVQTFNFYQRSDLEPQKLTQSIKHGSVSAVLVMSKTSKTKIPLMPQNTMPQGLDT
jgi:hypothetical protein